MKLRLTTLLIGLALSLGGCLVPYTNTRLVETTVNGEQPPQPPYRSVLVGVLVNHEIRPALEQAIVERLRFMGVDAKAAYPIYGNKGIEGKSLDYLEQRIREYGFDSAVAVHLIEKSEEVHQVNSSPSIPVPPSLGLTMQPEVFGPDYFIKEDIYIARADFWDISRQTIVWSGKTVTVSPHGLIQGGDRFGEVIANHLVRAGLFREP